MDRVCVNKRFRLNQARDFQRVRNIGKKFSHPLFVLFTLPNELNSSRLGVICSRNVGNAVQRNLVKRRIKNICGSFLKIIPSGNDLILIARKDILQSKYSLLYKAIEEKFLQAGLFEK